MDSHTKGHMNKKRPLTNATTVRNVPSRNVLQLCVPSLQVILRNVPVQGRFVKDTFCMWGRYFRDDSQVDVLYVNLHIV